MCIRDRYQRRVRDDTTVDMATVAEESQETPVPVTTSEWAQPVPAYGYPNFRRCNPELGGLFLDEPSSRRLVDQATKELCEINHSGHEIQLSFSEIEFAGLRVEHNEALSDMRNALDGAVNRVHELRRIIQLNKKLVSDAVGPGAYEQLMEQAGGALDHLIYVDTAVAEAMSIVSDMRAHTSSHQTALDMHAAMDANIATMLAAVHERATRQHLTEGKNFAEAEYVQRAGSLGHWGKKLTEMRMQVLKSKPVDLGELKTIWDKVLNAQTLGPEDCTLKAELLHGIGGCEWLYARVKPCAVLPAKNSRG
eukprot:TRINITY_DN50205_c0_g1_i1.p1 TRINITY_DN50205_c0_g1~~TRINITY_DN50205_c0_g1_i1.p1  ORF type:complete len:308 (-),score=62.23 TRINITY_DN50205_c0_g1_i1:415-1338(-)